MSNYYKVRTVPKPSPYVVSGSLAGSTFKTRGNRSEMYDIISNQKVADDDQCCPSTTSFGPVMTGDEWMRMCFDKTEKKWCENEGNVINLLFYHELMIPTDTDQAEPLALGYGRINKIRVNFLFDEPAVRFYYHTQCESAVIKHRLQIEFGYSFVGSNPMVVHYMHLKSYEEVGMDPGKLYLHVVKDGSCHGRLLSVNAKIILFIDMVDEDFTNAPEDSQCLVVYLAVNATNMTETSDFDEIR
ncbi:hypothetical protein OSTOST_14879, partial [Ostertagia ostertagi]